QLDNHFLRKVSSLSVSVGRVAIAARGIVPQWSVGMPNPQKKRPVAESRHVAFEPSFLASPVVVEGTPWNGEQD
ncbi:hypothetical protein, partial [Escherichia coli]|uniref:hypothetical protein n=1 Tax=Escherichia coli TaxID=562 RepID=UPI003CFB0A5F